MERRRDMLLLTLSILMASNAGDPGAAVPAVPNWYPVAGGLTWEYGISGTQAFGADTADIAGSMTRKVAGVFQHSGGFPVSMIVSDVEIEFTPRSGEEPTASMVSDTFFVLVTDSLVLRYQSLDSDECGILMKLPLEVGSTWSFHPSVPTTDEVSGLDDTISVPAGTYAGCAHISETFTVPEAAGSFNDFYFADGVGAVMFILHAEVQDRVDNVVFELRR
jgi:hypothetical protein